MSSKAQRLQGRGGIRSWWERSEGPDLRRRQAFASELRQAWMRVAVQLARVAPPSKPWALGVTSAVRGEGRTASSIGLVMALARETTDPVVLVDADLRSPALAEHFGLNSGYGLGDYLENLCALDAAFAPTSLPNLRVMPACMPKGRLVPSIDAPFVFRLRLPALLSRLREEFRYLVFDLPPLLQDANTGGIASELDGVLLVTRAGMTQIHQLQESVEFMHGARLLATINIEPPPPVPSWAQTLFRE